MVVGPWVQAWNTGPAKSFLERHTRVIASVDYGAILTLNVINRHPPATDYLAYSNSDALRIRSKSNQHASPSAV